MDRLRGRVAALAQTRASVEADLTAADAIVDELHATNAAARTAQLRSEAEIHDPTGLRPPLEEGRIEGLRSWLATLGDTAAEGPWAAGRVGLDHWLVIAREYLAVVRAAGVREALSAP